MDINSFKYPKVIENLPKWLEQSNRGEKVELKTCQVVDDPYGTDIADFTFAEKK